FVQIYEPFLYRYIRRCGLQDADSREVVQEVFLGVAKAIGRWKPDPQQARFRTWLFRIARNQALTMLSRIRHHHVSWHASGPATAGVSQLLRVLTDGKPPCQAELEAEELEYRRAAFCWAAEQVRREVHAFTWQAFWKTAVEGTPVAEVATALQMPAGSVYVARSRVIQRLKSHIDQLEQETE
ncbi:MAG: sigma-70 family RNA polymerase sigma factor, partial [Planctomycetaceae bacterium]|nr:sigma-70 family RNA polymerase sigma factor [Planctomycetaceae bacterium]